MQLEIIPVAFLYQIAPTINAFAFLNAATLIVGAICSGNGIRYNFKNQFIMNALKYMDQFLALEE